MSIPDDRELPEIEQLSEDSGLCGGPGQITCSEANELIQFYVDKLVDKLGDTDADTGVEEHVGECPPCEFEVLVYQRIIESLERRRPHVPPDTAERLNRFCSELRSGAHDQFLED